MEYMYRVYESNMCIEYDLPLPMILMGENYENYVKPLDCLFELASEARKKTVNELPLLLLKIQI